MKTKEKINPVKRRRREPTSKRSKGKKETREMAKARNEETKPLNETRKETERNQKT